MTTSQELNVERADESRSAEGLARMTDPDRLLADWESLLASRHHLHPPEAARVLDVPESALVAARIGRGATRLDSNIDRLLRPISDWGRVLCAFSNASGVHMPLGEVSASSDGDALRLSGDHMNAEVDRAAITDAYLFVDTDESHGNTRSVQFFNAAGRAVLKVFIFHKSKFEAAERGFVSCASPNQIRTVATGIPQIDAFDAEAASVADDPDQQIVAGVTKTEIAKRLAAPGAIMMELVGDHARVTWRGLIQGARMDDAMFHLHETDIRSHLRYAAMTELALSENGALIIKGAESRLLRIARGDEL